LEWSTVQTSLTTTGQRLAIWGDWSGFTIVDRFGAQIELIPHLFGATNRFPTGQRAVKGHEDLPDGGRETCPVVAVAGAR
jgi:hypothetical protein